MFATPLRKIIVVSLLAVFLASLLVVSYLYSSNSRDEVVETEHHLANLSLALRQRVEAEVGNAIRMLEFAAALPVFSAPLRAEQNVSANKALPSEFESEKRKILKELQKKGRFTKLLILLPNGNPYLAFPFEARPADGEQESPTDESLLEQANHTQQSVISDSFLGAGGAPAIAIDVPVVRDGMIMAHLYGVFDLDHLSQLLNETLFSNLDTGFIVDRHGFALAHSDSGHLQGEGRARFAEHPVVKAYLEAPLPQGPVIKEGFDPAEGRQYLFLLTPLHPGWALVLGRRMDAVTADINARTLRETLPAGIIFLVVSGVGFFFVFRIGKRWQAAEKKSRRTASELAQEVQERQQIHKELLKTEERLLKAQRIARLGNWDWDLTRDDLWWSAEIANILGQTPRRSRVNFDTFLQCVHPDDREKVQQTVAEALHSGEAYNLEHRIIRPDGAVRIVHQQGEITLDQAGRPLRMVGTVQDVTEHREFEEAFEAVLRSTTRYVGQLFFQNLVEQLATALHVEYAMVSEVSETGDKARVLASWAGIGPGFGMEYDLKGTPCEKVLRQQVCLYSDQVQQHFPEDELLVGMEAQCYLGMPLVDSTGTRVLGILAVLDVKRLQNVPLARSLLEIFSARASTELERLQAEREKTRLEFQLRHAQKMEAIGTLAGGIAHDFNNILTAIIGYSELIKAKVAQESGLQRHVDQLLRAGCRARDLVSQILAFSRNSEPERKPVLLQPIVEEALKFIRASIPSTIEIRQEIEPDCGAVLADPTQLHQILVNLCANATYAMEKEGGVLTVAASDTYLQEAEVIGHPGAAPGPYIRLTVRDTGEGIRAEDLERIFEPYYTTKEFGKGSGIGLAMVHGIVQSYQGLVTVESAVSQGSTFHVFLPRHEVEPCAEIAAGEPVPTGEERILVVDDESVLVELMQETLEDLGYRVEAVTESPKALEIFRAGPEEFDLVITDQTMPGLTGTLLAKELLKIRPDLPIILCTGYHPGVSKERAEAIGVQEFAFKPVTRSKLACVVRKTLDHSKNPEACPG